MAIVSELIGPSLKYLLFVSFISSNLIINYFCGCGAESESFSRSKRFLWITHDRRLIFPPGTVLNLKPTLQIPFLRKNEPPDGIHSDIQISWFFYIIFNELGLTHGSHPWPPFYPFGSLFGPSKRSLSLALNEGHSKQERSSSIPILSLPSPSSFPGGERALIFPKLEALLGSLGWEGRPCLLRLVCETHEYPLKYGYGLVGEVFTLFFTVSNSHFAPSHLPSYLEAEEKGKSGNCTEYLKTCDKSLFRWDRRKTDSPNPDANHNHLKMNSDDHFVIM